MDSFIIISYLSVALIAEIRVIHYKKYNFYYPDIFLPNIYRYFFVAITSKKHKQKRGSPFSFHSKTATKG